MFFKYKILKFNEFEKLVCENKKLYELIIILEINLKIYRDKLYIKY